MIKRSESYYCDRCGKEMEERPLFYINGKNLSKNHIPDIRIQMLCGEWCFADLCDDCKRSFINWWEGGAE